MLQTKITINPSYLKYTSFIHSVHERFDKEGETIYQMRNTIKVFKINDLLINVKQYKAPNIINRFAYTFIRPPKATRAYQYAIELLSKGFYTPEPIATILLYKNGLLQKSYFISMQSPYKHTMYEFGKGPLAGREHIIQALGRYTAQLHENNVYHKDYSPGNILFQETDGEVKFCLIDINRMSFKPVSIEKGCANFARLWGKEDVFRLLAKEYAEARKADVEQCTEWVLYYRKRFWDRFAKKRAIPFEL